jgi:hypothetical protein
MRQPRSPAHRPGGLQRSEEVHEDACRLATVPGAISTPRNASADAIRKRIEGVMKSA